MIKATQILPEITYIIEEIIPSDLDVNLLEIGVVEGKTIRLIRKAPFSGAFAFEIGDNTICMRVSEANLINVVTQD